MEDLERVASQLRQQIQEAEHRRQKQLRVWWFTVRGKYLLHTELNTLSESVLQCYFSQLVEFKTSL